GLEMVHEPGKPPRPFYVHLTDAGKRVWEDFTRAHAAEVNAEDFPAHLVGPWAKLKGYAARLALIVHYLRLACRETTGDDVDGESMRRAVRLVDYFKSHARKVHAVMDADPRVARARRVVRWIAANRLKRFSKRDAHQALRGTFRAVEDMDPILALLEKHAIIRAEPHQGRGGPGRGRSPSYEAHPRLSELYAPNPRNSHNGPADDSAN